MLDQRPEIRIAEILDDGMVETTGRWNFGYFECIPAVGDTIVEPDPFEDGVTAYRVVGRQFVAKSGPNSSPRWWIILQPAEGSLWRQVCELDDYVDQAFVEMSRERSDQAAAEMHAEMEEKKRKRAENRAARLEQVPKGRQTQKPAQK